ncbi:hypothetical protein VC83_05546 [Pseudogymnoascus destructans]|uniref:Uncharacterized protein n=1 Tax=Pseudogymnoascus destructans TaxID=655981 RepID=A0A177A8B2_9PEZI|nr:uncharacterized protein VC83_05546 [Pseudogymnoascus destructans]OAF57672.1 hypothetical protein VC83_05546 [Pseudogymnoascus destructans]
MPVPTPSGALTVAFRVLCLRCLRAKARGIQSHDCVWSPTSSKCGYCMSQHSPCVPLPWFLGEEFEALLAAQSMPKFRSEVERDLYEEARATRAAVGKLPTAAAPAVAPTRGDGRREGEDGEVGAAYGA